MDQITHRVRAEVFVARIVSQLLHKGIPTYCRMAV